MIEAFFLPLGRMLLALSGGLLLASVVEALRWTDPLARLGAPFIRMARLGQEPAAAFSLAFVSAASANALLGEALAEGRLSERAVMISNLFNSLPSWLTHIPGIFFLTWPVLGFPALIYTAITLLAAALRTLLTVGLGRLLLPPCSLENTCTPFVEMVQRKALKGRELWLSALGTAVRRFQKRLPKLLLFVIPIYSVLFWAQRLGFFAWASGWLQENLVILDFLRPEALSVVVLYMAAEMGAAIGAAGALIHAGSLSEHEVVMALLIGNILSTPMRAIRHQLPAYSAYFPPAFALKLVLANQIFRALSVAFFTWLYLAFFF